MARSGPAAPRPRYGTPRARRRSTRPEIAMPAGMHAGWRRAAPKPFRGAESRKARSWGPGFLDFDWSGRRDSNSRPQPWQTHAARGAESRKARSRGPGFLDFDWSGRRDSNSRPQPWQTHAARGAESRKARSRGPGFLDFDWSGRRDSNSRPQPWQGCALPLSYARTSVGGGRIAGRPDPSQAPRRTIRRSGSERPRRER
jgi:hypothetical protein